MFLGEKIDNVVCPRASMSTITNLDIFYRTLLAGWITVCHDSWAKESKKMQGNPTKEKKVCKLSSYQKSAQLDVPIYLIKGDENEIDD